MLRSCPTECRPGPRSAMQVAGLPACDLLVQLIEGLHLGHRGEPGASEPADLALDAALLVRAFDAGVAVERVEAVVGAEQHPPRVLGPAPTRAVHTWDTAEVRLS
jgi:hypothetical protein